MFSRVQKGKKKARRYDDLVRGDTRVSDKSYSVSQCFGCMAMAQIGLLIQRSIDQLLSGNL